MIKIDQVWTYESEVCDCCEGYYTLGYSLTVNGEYLGLFDELHDLLLIASSHTTVLDYDDTEPPEPWNDEDD